MTAKATITTLKSIYDYVPSNYSSFSFFTNSTSSRTYYDYYTYQLNTLWKVAFIIVSLCMCIMTACGNLLVLEAFKVNKKLRTITNYFLISLACADLMIGVISIPMASFYFIAEKWLLGPIICDLWLSLDYTISNASMANMLLISFDRYFSLTRPIVYRAYRTGKKVKFSIAVSWLISAMLWTPFILFFNSKKRVIKDDECKVQFLVTNRYVTLGTAFAAFYLPVTIICVIYYKIWIVTKKRHGFLLKNLQLSSTLKHPRTFISSVRRNSKCAVEKMKKMKREEKEMSVSRKKNSETGSNVDTNSKNCPNEVWNMKTLKYSNSSMSESNNNQITSAAMIKVNNSISDELCQIVESTSREQPAVINCYNQFEVESSYYSILLNYLNENEAQRKGKLTLTNNNSEVMKSEAANAFATSVLDCESVFLNKNNVNNLCSKSNKTRKVYYFKSIKSKQTGERGVDGEDKFTTNDMIELRHKRNLRNKKQPGDYSESETELRQAVGNSHSNSSSLNSSTRKKAIKSKIY